MSDAKDTPPVSDDRRADVEACRSYVEQAAARGGRLHVCADGVYQRCMKRVLDSVFGSLLALAAAPVIYLAWAAIRLTSRGAGFFSQDRVGLDGKTIRVYKLRSMYIDHDKRVDMKEIEKYQAGGLLYKEEDDPRITPVGRFIRKTSIDELPQLWNVVRGDMSLVGPRPLMLHMVAPFPDINALRYQVRPGITGEWQINARHDNQSLAGMVKYDLHYVENYSFVMDARILLMTFPTVLNTKGAH